MNKRAKFIILGAGMPHHGSRPSSISATAGSGNVLDWQLNAAGSVGAEVTFVGGYGLDNIVKLYPDIRYAVNPDWETTGAVASLFKIPFDCDEMICSYSDILYRPEAVQVLSEVEADIVVAVDEDWRDRYQGRTGDDLLRCEKINHADYRVTRLGADIHPEFAAGEFVGLARFSSTVLQWMDANRDYILEHFAKERLSTLLEYLRMNGFHVRAHDVAGDWAEINNPKDLVHFILGTKAQTLARLQSMVNCSIIEDQISFTYEQWNSGCIGLIDDIRHTFPDQNLVVRSSALGEDGFATACAGEYTSVLRVPSSDAGQIEAAVKEVFSSYPECRDGDQVLVQPMLESVTASGVVFTRSLVYRAPYYVFNYDDVTNSTESITSGNSRDHKTVLIFRGAESGRLSVPEVVQKVLPAVQEIEALLNHDALDIEFAVDAAGAVHIFQVRPIAEKGYDEETQQDDCAIEQFLSGAVRHFQNLKAAGPFIAGKKSGYGKMPDWNPAEIIGIRPGRLAVSLYRYLIMDEIWAVQRAEFGYRDVRPAPLLVQFAGHPYVDIRASFNSFTPAALPDNLAEKLVDFYLGWLEEHPELHDKVEFGVVPTCYALDFDRWRERLTGCGKFSDVEVSLLEQELLRLTEAAIKRNPGYLQQIEILEDRYEKLMSADVAPLHRALMLLDDCRRYGTLVFSHLARNGFVAVTLLRSGVARGLLAQEELDRFMSSIRTVSGEFSHDGSAVASGDMPWPEFVAKYGHLRPGTYDITSPKYGDDPERFLRPMVVSSEVADDGCVTPGAWLSEQQEFYQALNEKFGLSAEVLEQFFRDAIAGREFAKFIFTKNLSVALDCIAEFGSLHGFSRDYLAHVPLDTLAGIRTGAVPEGSMIEILRQDIGTGHEEVALAGQIELPPLIFSEENFYSFMQPGIQPNFIGAAEVIAGVAVIDGKTDLTTVSLRGKIVLIPQADPGYDWIFGQQISGLVTMWGGANSHMAIRAAEFGLPAAIGVGENLYREIQEAEELLLNAGQHRIKVIR